MHLTTPMGCIGRRYYAVAVNHTWDMYLMMGRLQPVFVTALIL